MRVTKERENSFRLYIDVVYMDQSFPFFSLCRAVIVGISQISNI